MNRTLTYSYHDNEVTMLVEGAFCAIVYVSRRTARVIKYMEGTYNQSVGVLEVPWRYLEQNDRSVTGLVGETNWLRWSPPLKEMVRIVSSPAFDGCDDVKFDFGVHSKGRATDFIEVEKALEKC